MLLSILEYYIFTDVRNRGVMGTWRSAIRYRTKIRTVLHVVVPVFLICTADNDKLASQTRALLYIIRCDTVQQQQIYSGSSYHIMRYSNTLYTNTTAVKYCCTTEHLANLSSVTHHHTIRALCCVDPEPMTARGASEVERDTPAQHGSSCVCNTPRCFLTPVTPQRCGRQPSQGGLPLDRSFALTTNDPGTSNILCALQ